MTSVSSGVCAKIDSMVQEVSERAIPFIPITDLRSLLSVYFKTPYAVLLDRENMPPMADAKAITYDGDDCGPTTGESLFNKLHWSDVREIVKRLEDQSVAVSGVQYQGRYAYVLACWVGKEDPSHPANIEQFGPMPKSKHNESAVKAFLKEIKRFL